MENHVMTNLDQSSNKGQYVIDHIEELAQEDSFYLKPWKNIFEWCKNLKKLQPKTAMILFDKLFERYSVDVYKLIHYISIDSNDPQTAAMVLSAFNNQLCRTVYDTSPIYDISYDIEQLRNQIQVKEEKIQNFEIQSKELKATLIKNDTTINELTHMIEQLKLKIKNDDEHNQKLVLELKETKKSLIEGQNVINNQKKKISELETVIAKHSQIIAERDQEISSLKCANEVSDVANDENSTLTTSNGSNVSENVEKISLDIMQSFSNYEQSLKNIVDQEMNKLKQHILEKYTQEQLNMSCNNRVAEIEVSSLGDCDILDVLKFNDIGGWVSENHQNSWIQFDFHPLSIKLQSYSLKSNRGPKSWKVEGSSDSKTYIVIDQRDTNDYFKCNEDISLNFPVESTQETYRYIRITQGDDGSVYNDHYFLLNGVELYGSLYQ